MFILQTLQVNTDHFELHFQDILDNLDIKLITPFLIASGIILPDDYVNQVELEKMPKKLAVEFVLRNIRNNADADVLFKHCLTQTSESQGHQKLLSILYGPKVSKSGMTLLC